MAVSCRARASGSSWSTRKVEVYELWYVSVLWTLTSPNTKQKSRAQPLKELHICLVIREVLLALAFLHKNGVIHRDIKGTFAFFFPSSFTLHVADLIMQPPTSFSPPSLIAFYFATLASPHSFNPPPPNGPLLSARLTGWPPRS